MSIALSIKCYKKILLLHVTIFGTLNYNIMDIRHIL